MPLPPALPLPGLAGFRFLERTFERQLETFSKSPDIQRDIDYFRANAGAANSLDAFMADRRLLRVALGAFGLEDQADKTAFVRKVIEDGTIERTALANRLSNKAWARFSEAIGFGNLGGTLNTTDRREALIERFRLTQFESALAEIDVDIAEAVSFRRKISAIATKSTVDRAGWFEIMGDTGLRRVVELAFGLPSSFGTIDIEDQRRELEDRASRLLDSASPAVFQDPEAVDFVLSRFLLRAQVAAGPGPGTPGSAALTLLQNSGLASAGRSNLIASLF